MRMLTKLQQEIFDTNVFNTYDNYVDVHGPSKTREYVARIYGITTMQVVKVICKQYDLRGE